VPDKPDDSKGESPDFTAAEQRAAERALDEIARCNAAAKDARHAHAPH